MMQILSDIHAALQKSKQRVEVLSVGVANLLDAGYPNLADSMYPELEMAHQAQDKLAYLYFHTMDKMRFRHCTGEWS
jgi:hypothetical protein